MNDKEFKRHTEDVYARVVKAFEDIDPDDAEADFHLDNITITFSSGTRFVINRQNPVHQIWLATKKKGLHFNRDPETQQWLCSRSGGELFDILSDHCSAELSYEIKI